jgi:hypothetical protein
MNRHLGILRDGHPFSCDVCNKSFSLSCDMKNHHCMHGRE